MALTEKDLLPEVGLDTAPPMPPVKPAKPETQQVKCKAIPFAQAEVIKVALEKVPTGDGYLAMKYLLEAPLVDMEFTPK